MSRTEVKYFFILYLVFTAILPVFSTIGGFGNLGIPIASFLSKPVFYTVIGYHAYQWGKNMKSSVWKYLLAIIVACIIIVSGLKLVYFNKIGIATQVFDEMLNPLISTSLFILLIKLFERVNFQKMKIYIVKVASTTFNVFLIGDIIKNMILIYLRPTPDLATFIWLTPLTFVVSMAVTLVLKKSRIVSKII